MVVVAHQLAPAAFGLGAAVSVRSLRQTGEWTALESLGNGPARVLYPVAFVGLGIAALLWGAEDPLVAPAHRRAEEITVQRFRRWGDWSAYNSPRHWFRGAEGRVYRLGHPSHDGYEDVTILELDAGFRLQRRLDAARVDPAADGAWQMTGVVERRFGSDGAVSESRFDEKIERFREQIDLFQLKTGRPSQLSRADVVGQIALRERLGLPVREWKVTLQERRVYPFMLIPMGLAGAALALRRQRTGGLTTALGEGLGMTAAAWVLSLLGRTVAMAGHVDPLIGAVVPLLVLSAVAVVLVRRAL
jgi:lipopolysaccharide export LptBFGC system permease protein LptF